MGFRMRKSFKVAPGLRVNVSKSGASLSAGVRGATANLSSRGIRTTVGIPGTGLSYSATSPTKRERSASEISGPSFTADSWYLEYSAADLWNMCFASESFNWRDLTPAQVEELTLVINKKCEKLKTKRSRAVAIWFAIFCIGIPFFVGMQSGTLSGVAYGALVGGLLLFINKVAYELSSDGKAKKMWPRALRELTAEELQDKTVQEACMFVKGSRPILVADMVASIEGRTSRNWNI